jgi:hypothetical protein
MPRGGARPGAGRKRGGQAIETTKLRTVARAKLAEYLTTGKDPLEVLIGLAFNDELDVSLRIQAATAAVPYLHPKLSHQNIESRSLHATVNSADLLAKLEVRLGRLAAPGPVIEGPAPIEGERATAEEA